ncbi:MAG: polyphosphate kinase 1 [Sphingobacteriales bacterium]|nr:MAG: polyphosphate kinase 1 [Sphingobacteriales bacterium]
MEFFNRDLSWLKFNHRVLQEAADPTVPLMERIRFLSISSSNLDEFFRVRYPSVLALSKLKPKTRKKLDAAKADALADAVQEEINKQQKELGGILTKSLLPGLEENNIVLYFNSPLSEVHRAEVREIFISRVLAFVQPVFLEGNTTYSFEPENNQLYLIITLRAAGEELQHHAVVKIPADQLPRFYKLSPLDGKDYFILIDDIVRENTDCIFPGFEIHSTYSFKVNRDAELLLDDEYEGDMLNKIERQLKKRDFGPPSRFLYESGMPRNIQLFLATSFRIEHDEMFEGGRYHNMRDLGSLPIDRKELNFPTLKPLSAPGLYNCSDIFPLMEEKDILLHFPFDSYNPILAFFNQAAIDPYVEEIYITLYRVATDSVIVNALISAARNGKKVTVFIELKARFDEANNILWGKRMEEAGINIIYSIPDIKVHSKIALVRRRSAAGDFKSFCILSTGNFNESTARFYTDHTLLSSDPSINAELLTLFQFLQKRKMPTVRNESLFKTLLVSSFNMITSFEKLIKGEIAKVKSGQKGLIRIKLNNLEEPQMITRLYEASQAGVEVHMIVRSICCIIPGKKGLSERVEVRRIVDRYLEHTRLFIFGEDGNAQVIMGSSDWMNRNLHRRIEVCAPITDPDCRRQLVDYFNIQWKDNVKAVRLLPDLQQEKISSDTVQHIAQSEIYQYLQTRS